MESAGQTITQPDTIGKRTITRLDQLVQILEISFIFLLIFSLIALVDTALSQLEFYEPLSNQHLGRPRIGSLSGGNWEAIVRITLIFNLLLFGFSLFFGIWMRRTRDGWTWQDLGYTFSTRGYSLTDLLRRGFILGLVAIVIHFSAVMLIMLFNPDLTVVHGLVYFYPTEERIFTPRELRAEYYFGIIEMGFIWPLSAGFFFFAYCHKSLDAKFPTGVANVLSSAFYVFYLQFFFLIPEQNKLSQYGMRLTDPIGFAGFWIMSIGLFLILYINFSAFAETGSIVLPFLMNFIYNVGITIMQAGNALVFDTVNYLMFFPLVVVVVIIGIWIFVRPDDFSTIRKGLSRLSDMGKIKLSIFVGYVLIFVTLSFFVPSLINELLYLRSAGELDIQSWVIPVLYAVNFVILIVMATVILTYEPTDVFDVLLVSSDGIPIASHIEIFETDDVLISGFFTALQAVDQELSADGGLKSIKRGEREILIEQGVFSQVIALADSDQSSIRQSIGRMHRNFEIMNQERLERNSGEMDFAEANSLVRQIGDLSITFNIPTQTRWISIISLALAPIMISLIGLI